MARRPDPGLPPLGTRAAPRRQWRRLPGRRCRRASQSHYRRRHRHRFPRRTRRRPIHPTQRPQQRIEDTTPRTRHPPADPPHHASLPAERLFASRRSPEFIHPRHAQRNHPRRIRTSAVECSSTAAPPGPIRSTGIAVGEKRGNPPYVGRIRPDTLNPALQQPLHPSQQSFRILPRDRGLSPDDFFRRIALKLAVIGCGYVGLVTGACLAEAGHDVICTDIDAERIAQLQAGLVPIYELYLDKILTSARKSGKISYTANAGDAIRASDAIFICVGTPPKDNGDADLSAIDHVARQIATEARSSKLIIEKSTVPARTGLELRRALNAYSRNSGLTFRVVSNPEFLREGTAVEDVLNILVIR